MPLDMTPFPLPPGGEDDDTSAPSSIEKLSILSAMKHVGRSLLASARRAQSNEILIAVVTASVALAATHTEAQVPAATAYAEAYCTDCYDVSPTFKSGLPPLAVSYQNPTGGGGTASNTLGPSVTAVATGYTTTDASVTYYFSVTGPQNLTNVPIVVSAILKASSFSPASYLVSPTCCTATSQIRVYGPDGEILSEAACDRAADDPPTCSETNSVNAALEIDSNTLYSITLGVAAQAFDRGEIFGTYDASSASSYLQIEPSFAVANPAYALSFSPSIQNLPLEAPLSGPQGKRLGDCGCSSPDGVGRATGGDPIGVATANLYEEFTDFKTVGPNSLEFIRYYNSMGSSNGIFSLANTLGTNWRTNYDRFLQIGESTVIAERPNGQQLTFTRTPTGWKTDSDLDFDLIQSSGTWMLTDHGGSVETYSEETGTVEGLPVTIGQLNSIEAQNGYVQILNYNSTHALVSVTDSYGRSLGLTYQANGLLQRVTTPDTLVLTYSYKAVDGGIQMVAVSYNSSPKTSRTYLYENAAFPFALTGIKDENGGRFATWAYDLGTC